MGDHSSSGSKHITNQASNMSGKNAKPPRLPIKKSIRILFRVTGVVLITLAMWIALSVVEYSSADPGFPLRTSGMFVFSYLFFTVPISLLFSSFFLLLSRWTGPRKAWSVMLLTGLMLSGWALPSTLPRNRLKAILGEPAAKASTLELLLVADSMNDGFSYVGAVSGTANLLPLVQQHRKLERKTMAFKASLFALHFPDTQFSESDDIYADHFFTFWTNPTGTKICFTGQSRVKARPPSRPSQAQESVPSATDAGEPPPSPPEPVSSRGPEGPVTTETVALFG